ncbi:MAG: 50S ribosomal protein L6 [Patescibacteria group bacterium]|nr:50S ribosomal protein L6 [Patescibacteria group bacterium]
MSRVGKKIIQIPDKVEVKVEAGLVMVKGPKGELTLKLHPAIGLELKDKEINMVVLQEEKYVSALWGTMRQLVNNMILGVTVGFKKELEINGVGYRASVSGKNLMLAVGYSHEVKFPIPDGIKISVDKNVITIEGNDKFLVGETAAQIKRVKKPEPYKGKGIRYLGEIIKIKAGKKAKTAAA